VDAAGAGNDWMMVFIADSLSMITCAGFDGTAIDLIALSGIANGQCEKTQKKVPKVGFSRQGDSYYWF
jgi:hypothetical protein